MSTNELLENIPLNTSFMLTMDVTKVYLHGNYGTVSLNGRNSSRVIKWLLYNLNQHMSYNDIIEITPPAQKSTIKSLLNRLIADKFITYNHPSFQNNKRKNRLRESLKLICYDLNFCIDQITKIFSNYNVELCGRGTSFKVIKNEIRHWPFKQVITKSAKDDLSNFVDSINQGFRYIHKIDSDYTIDYCVIQCLGRIHLFVLETDNYLLFSSELHDLAQLYQCFKLKNASNYSQDTKANKKQRPSFKFNLLTRLVSSLIENNYFNIGKCHLINLSTLEISMYNKPLFIHKLSFKNYLKNTMHQDKMVLRKDVPVFSNNESLITYSENINESARTIIDAFSGPILKISESNYRQIPLSTTSCCVLPYNINTNEQRLLRMYGLSARECRNQITLEAFDHYIQSFCHLNNIKSRVIASGWTDYEAIFRALRKHVKTHPKLLNSVNEKALALDAKCTYSSSTMNYLMSICLEKHINIIPITVCRLGHSLYLVKSSSENNMVEIGITVKHAINNLLLTLIADMLNKEQSNQCYEYFSTFSWQEIYVHKLESFISTASKMFDIKLVHIKSFSENSKLPVLYKVSINNE